MTAGEFLAAVADGLAAVGSRYRPLSPAPARAARQIQRRIKTWTGKTQRDWQTHARLEQAFARGVNATQGSIAELAVDAGYSDQSHMGREIKRLTGYSPARLMKLINSDEQFGSIV